MRNTLTLIPRTKVNYTLLDLVKACFVKENTSNYKHQVLQKLSTYFGTNNIVLTASGRSALYELLSILPQKRVLIPSYTCKAVLETCIFANKDVVYCKVDPKTFNMTIDGISKLIDENTIVIATHQYGIPCDIKNIIRIAKENNAVVIEDCAASFGSSVDGKLCGLWGDFSFFSLDSSKLITLPPKGGFIICNDKKILNIIACREQEKKATNQYKIRNIISGCEYWLLKNKFIYRIFHYVFLERKKRWQLNDSKRLNKHLDGFYTHTMYQWQAKIALRQLNHIDDIINKRKDIYKYFYNNIKESPRVTLPPYSEESCPIRFAIRVDDKDKAYKFFVKNGVDMAFSFSHVFCPNSFTNAHQIAATVLDIPYYYGLSNKEIKRIVKVINRYSALN